MPITDLPAEIFQHILYESFRPRDLKRRLRLRLVSKRFAIEVVEIIHVYRLLDSYLLFGGWGGEELLPNFLESYIARRALIEPEDGKPFLLMIRNMAKYLEDKEPSADPGNYDEIIRSHVFALASATVNNDDETHMRNILIQEASTAAYTDFSTHLLSAALVLDKIFVAKSLVETCCEVDDICYMYPRHSSIFGDPNKLIALKKLIELVELCPHPHRNGDVSAWNEHFEGFKILTARWVEAMNLTDPATSLSWIHTWLQTPDIRIFDYVMGIKKIRREWNDVPTTLVIDYLLVTVAGEGWIDMTKHLLELGANTEGPSNTNSYTSTRTPLVEAARNGHAQVIGLLIHYGANTDEGVATAARHCHDDAVKTLLEAGASLTGTNIEAYAKLGLTRMIQLLINHGVDPNIGEPPPLVSAIALEHTVMFEMLLKNGARMTNEVARRCALVAKAEKLESMVELLERNGVDTSWVKAEDIIEEVLI